MNSSQGSGASREPSTTAPPPTPIDSLAATTVLSGRATTRLILERAAGAGPVQATMRTAALGRRHESGQR